MGPWRWDPPFVKRWSDGGVRSGVLQLQCAGIEHGKILVLPHARERENAFFVAEVKCSNGGVKNENYFCATGLNYRNGQNTIICPDGKCNDSLCCIRILILHFCVPFHRLSHRVRACFGLSLRFPSLLIILPFLAAFFRFPQH